MRMAIWLCRCDKTILFSVDPGVSQPPTLCAAAYRSLGSACHHMVTLATKLPTISAAVCALPWARAGCVAWCEATQCRRYSLALREPVDAGFAAAERGRRADVADEPAGPASMPACSRRSS